MNDISFDQIVSYLDNLGFNVVEKKKQRDTPIPDDIECVSVGMSSINIEDTFSNISEYRPTRIYLKTNGSIENEPSFAILGENLTKDAILLQISLKMLQDCLFKLGYKLENI